jgi:hypothetical protein
VNAAAGAFSGLARALGALATALPLPLPLPWHLLAGG